MRITADTNVLVRAAVQDDPAQGALATDLLANAETIAVPLPVLCEFVWVLSRVYRKPRTVIAEAIRNLLDAENVCVDLAAAAEGLAMLDAGGDFADGVIAFDGRRLGGTIFVSFDSDAAKLITAAGGSAQLLG